jgi:SAM-dependent methyltransferase
MKIHSLTTPEDWHRQGYSRPPVQAASEFQKFLDRYLPKRKDWSVLEIGACPGSHLLAIALTHGYKPTAFDYLPAVRQLPETFARFGVPDLEVIEADFLTFSTARKFNVVMSYGFIEHFSDPEDIIRRHWDLVAEGGYLVLGAPAFGPKQLALRRLILKPDQLEQTLRAHDLRITNVRAIADICLQLPAAHIERATSVGHMEAWFSPHGGDVRRNRAWLVALWRVVGRIPKWLNWSSRRFSPLCLVIVRRTTAP